MAAGTTRSTDTEKTRIMLGLLESVQRGEDHSQRRLAAELGIALGLVNAYLKRCITKGLVKVSEAPAKRYAYYLTPGGFAEKSRLTVEYLSYSLSLLRRAKTDCSSVLQAARVSGTRSIALLGMSDLAEIAVICALDCGMRILAVVDETSEQRIFAGVSVRATLDGLENEVDAVLVTAMTDTMAVINAAVERFGAERVLVPALLATQQNGLTP